MLYIKIPIKSIKEGKEISDDIFGAMMWNTVELKGKMMAYPYDSNNPVIIDTED